MSVITLEPGGPRPPTSQEQAMVRLALGCEHLTATLADPTPTDAASYVPRHLGQWLRKATAVDAVFDWYQWNGTAWRFVRRDGIVPTSAPYELPDNISGNLTLDRNNGERQYGMMIGNTTIAAPDNFEEGQCLTLCFFTNGGEWDLDFAGSIQMSAEAEAALPITLPNSKAYIIELQMTGFLPVLTAFHGPTDVD